MKKMKIGRREKDIQLGGKRKRKLKAYHVSTYWRMVGEEMKRREKKRNDIMSVVRVFWVQSQS